MNSDGSVLAGYLMPHPPVIVPEVSRGSNQALATVAALEKVAAQVADLQPDTVVIISPHAPMFSDFIFMYDEPTLKGDLGQFGAADLCLAWDHDAELQAEIFSRFKAHRVSGGGLSAHQMHQYGIKRDLDHGCLVPLYFLNQRYSSFRLVAMASSDLPLPEIYAAGTAIAEAAASLGRKIVIVASGDLSHKANSQSPYGSCPEGAEFDEQLMARLTAGDLPAVLDFNPDRREKAAECGYRSVVMLCGAFSRMTPEVRVLNYEAPYGIGYGVVSMKPGLALPADSPTAMELALDKQLQANAANRKLASPQVQIARTTLEQYLKDGRRLTPADFPQFAGETELTAHKAGVFVSLKKMGQLRGCIGTTQATTPSILEEIIQNALSAGLNDPRFEPVAVNELPYLTYSVDVLGQPEPIASRAELDPAVYGVIVRKGSHSGLLLPDLEGVDTVDEQLAIACRKGGIDSHGDFQMWRFKVTRYH
jgi:AmmeMemoRadiSam system protein A